MIARVLPPVFSPLSLHAVAQGWRGLFGADPARLESASALLRSLYGARQVLLTDSGTTALALALRRSVELRPDTPRIALPAWSCYDLATAADTAQVDVLLYDLDPATLAPDWTSLGRALATGVAAVVVVHPFGLPVQLSQIAGRVAEAGATLIEDAAQGVGAWIGARRAGAVGDLGVLSFGRGKGWTGGSGGALLLNPGARAHVTLPEPGELSSAPRDFGAPVKLTAQWLVGRPFWYALPSALPFLRLGQTVYRSPRPPARMAPSAAAVLLATAPLMDREVERRRGNAAMLLDTARATGAGLVPVNSGDTQASWLRFPLLPKPALLSRARTREARRMGITPGYPLTLGQLPGFSARLTEGHRNFSGAEVLAAGLLTLPTHGQLGPSDLARLQRWLEARI